MSQIRNLAIDSSSKPIAHLQESLAEAVLSALADYVDDASISAHYQLADRFADAELPGHVQAMISQLAPLPARL